MNIIKSLEHILLPYDYIVVGAGMTGCTIAALLTGTVFFGIHKNKRVLVIEKREDVYKIRQFVEEKSSALCITSQIKPNNK